MDAPLGQYAHLLPPSWTSTITQWLAEDTPSFDYGGYVVGESEEEATLLGKQSGILAGVPFFEEIFKQLGCSVTWLIKEGDQVDASKGRVEVAKVRGKARHLLLGERVALNTLARCSGIATKSRRLLVAARQAGYKGIIAGTRKTTPGFRLVEKYGMLVGGVDPHRYDLSSMVMLKDNHLDAKGSIPEAIKACRQVSGFSLRIDVECRTEQDAIQAFDAGADVVMLDNFEGQALRSTAANLKKRYPSSRTLIEVSGGLTEDNVGEYYCEDVDIMSTSSVHQGVGFVDFSLKLSLSKLRANQAGTGETGL